MQLKFDWLIAFHGKTWNYRKNGEPFLMNWYGYAICGERPKPIYYVAELEDVTGLQALRLKQSLLVNPNDADALSSISFLNEGRPARKGAWIPES